MDYVKWVEMGKSFGLADKELMEFVTKKECEYLEREERVQAREDQRRKEEERDRQSSREFEERRRKEEIVLEEKRRAFELEKIHMELELQQARAQGGNADMPYAGGDFRFRAPLPKLPVFNEEKDDMDAFIERFERFASSQKWPRDTWAVGLSPLLTGNGLDVYTGMPAHRANDYDELKKALLRRYLLTEEGFRSRFRDSKPEKGESVFQFVSRLARYFNRWVELSDKGGTVDDLKDLLLREQFIQVCSPELALFIRERRPKDIEVVVDLAERYIEAHGGSITKSMKTAANQSSRLLPRTAPSYDANIHTTPGARSTNQKVCFSCHKEGHFARDCPENRRKKSASAAVIRDDENEGQHIAEEKHSSEQAGLCQSIEPEQSPLKDCIEDGQLKLANGEFIRVMNGVCDKHKVSEDGRMPVCQGYVGEVKVDVLRDTGCSGVAVKYELVIPSQMTGREHYCVLIDGTIRRFPIAKIAIDTPYFKGEVEAMCMKKPIYDLVIGNIQGVRDTMDAGWQVTGLPEEASAMTRAQAKKEKETTKPLKVPDLKQVSVDIAKLKEAQENDVTLENVWEYARKGTPKSTRGGQEHRYEVRKGVLYRVFTHKTASAEIETKQVVVPQQYRRYVMELAHETIVGGHLGTQKTLDRITSNFHWPGITSDVKRFCRSCDICQKTIPKGKVSKVPLGTMPLIDTPFHRIAIDLIGELVPMSERGHRYILTVVDFATRYPEAIALKKIDTETVSEALLGIFCRLGFPREVLSDQGRQFVSDLMKEVSRLVSIKQLFTTPYNPKCNGLCEKMNGVLKSMVKKLCQERPKDWDRYLPAVLFAYREVPQASTGFSPFELLYGRTVRGPMQVLKELWTESEEPEVKSTYQYVLDLRNRLEETCKIARESLRDSQERYKHFYDRGKRTRTFSVGDKVLVLLPTDNNKLLLQWKGPFSVIGVINEMDLKVDVNGRVKIYHVNLLRKYEERTVIDEERDCQNAAGMAIIEAEDNDDPGVIDDENLLDLMNTVGKETYRDVQVSPDLTCEQKEQVWSLLEEYQDIFTDVPGTTHLEEHKIDLTTVDPIRVKPYPVPYAKRNDVREEIHKMLDAGVIESSNSPYTAPVVMVRKKDGTYRFCIDFCLLNRVTRFDAEPMGNPEDILTRLGDSQYYTKIDLSKGYWQIPVEEKSKHMTAFTTPDGCYQFKKMPFGMVNSGATFNRMMRKLLAGLERAENYVDDMLGHTFGWVEHLDVLREVFTRVRHAGLTLRPSKCLIGYRSIGFAGQVIGEGKVAMETGKLEQIRDAERPKTKKQVRSFLGLAGYYRRFIPNFAEVAVPLTDLTKKGQPNSVKWDQPQERAFKMLRDLLTQAPILRLPDFSRQFILETDASDVGVGAALLQEYEDGRFPVAYASKKLLQRERNYSVIERECLAIVFGVKKFQKYLYGKEFVLHTDHRPLSFIQKCKIESGRIMRWSLFLQNYKFRVEAIKGSENVVADYLSRQY